MDLVSFEDVTETIQFPLRMKAISAPRLGDKVTFAVNDRLLTFEVVGVEWSAEYPMGNLNPLVKMRPVHFSPPPQEQHHD